MRTCATEVRMGRLSRRETPRSCSSGLRCILLTLAWVPLASRGFEAHTGHAGRPERPRIAEQAKQQRPDVQPDESLVPVADWSSLRVIEPQAHEVVTQPIASMGVPFEFLFADLPDGASPLVDVYLNAKLVFECVGEDGSFAGVLPAIDNLGMFTLTLLPCGARWGTVPEHRVQVSFHVHWDRPDITISIQDRSRGRHRARCEPSPYLHYHSISSYSGRELLAADCQGFIFPDGVLTHVIESCEAAVYIDTVEPGMHEVQACVGIISEYKASGNKSAPCSSLPHVVTVNVCKNTSESIRVMFPEHEDKISQGSLMHLLVWVAAPLHDAPLRCELRRKCSGQLLQSWVGRGGDPILRLDRSPPPGIYQIRCTIGDTPVATVDSIFQIRRTTPCLPPTATKSLSFSRNSASLHRAYTPLTLEEAASLEKVFHIHTHAHMRTCAHAHMRTCAHAHTHPRMGRASGHFARVILVGFHGEKEH